MAEKQWLPDLASSDVGGRVVYANDQLFADRRNLIRPEPSAHQTHTFGPDGKIYDGWETRRRRDQGHDHAIVRLGMPGVVRSVVIDTAHFKGNYPPFASIEPPRVRTTRWPRSSPRARGPRSCPRSR